MLLLFLNPLHCFHLIQAKKQSPYSHLWGCRYRAWPSIASLTSFLTNINFTFTVPTTFNSSVMLGSWRFCTCYFLCYSLSLDISHFLSALLKCPLLRVFFLITLNKRRLLPKLRIVLPKPRILFYFSPVYQKQVFIFIVCLPWKNILFLTVGTFLLCLLLVIDNLIAISPPFPVCMPLCNVNLPILSPQGAISFPTSEFGPVTFFNQETLEKVNTCDIRAWATRSPRNVTLIFYCSR